jgi:hypothetical protein
VVGCECERRRRVYRCLFDSDRCDSTEWAHPGPCPVIPFQNRPVYYLQWVIITDPQWDWVELGSAYQCVGQRYWFAAYGDGGVFHALFAEWNFPVQQNFYDIHRLAEWWSFDINGLNKYTFPWNAVGIRNEAGLESWNGHVDTVWIDHWQLQRTLSEGPWGPWCCMSTFPPPGAPEMCGQKVSNTHYRTRQAAPGTSC